MSPTLVVTGFDHFQSMVLARRLAPARAYLLSDVDDAKARSWAPNSEYKWSGAVYGTKTVDVPPRIPACPREDLDIVTKVLSSSYPLLMMDRQPMFPPKDMLRHQQAILRSALRCIEILRQHGIRRVVSCSTPHQAATFIMFNVAKLMGLECFVLERSPLPHRYWITGGLGEKLPTVCVNAGGPFSNRTREMVTQITGTGESPTGDLVRQRANYGSASYSLHREFTQIFRSMSALRPWGAVFVFFKYRLWRNYQRLCRMRPPVGNRRATFFLHYQPERTTLPEAGMFVVQGLALTMLDAMLPDDYEIVVREHPSTWLLPLQYGGRSIADYECFAALKRLKFVSSTHNINDLIDSSAVVATCTGKVGLQALLRGKPVLAFGFPAYANHPFCRRVETQRDLQAAIDWLGTLGPDQQERIVSASLAYVQAIEDVSREEPPIAKVGSRRAQRLAALTTELEMLFSSAHNETTP